jgi:hypothetical protein
MKSNNKLNKALIEALRDKPEPLHEAQWDKLYAELHKEKKRRFLWIFFVWGLIGVGAAASYLVWGSFSDAKLTKPAAASSINKTNIVSDSDGLVNSTVSESELTHTNTNQTINSIDASNASVGNPSELLNPEKKPANIRRNYKRNYNSSHFSDYEADNVNDKNYTFNNDTPEVKENESHAITEISKNPINDLTPGSIFNPDLNTDLSGTMLKEKKLTQTVTKPDSNSNLDEDKTSLSHDNKKDTLHTDLITDLNKKDEEEKKKKKVNEDDKFKAGNGKFVFGLSYGFNFVNTKVVRLEKEEFLHKDTRNIFDSSNANQSSQYVNFSFEYKFKNFGLRLNSGLQYRSVYNKVDFNYKLREVALRNPDNSIVTYIPVPDSSALKFHVSNPQSMRFLTLPVLLSYGWPIGNKYEFILNAGVNFTTMIGSSGTGFDINSQEEKDIGSLIKQKLTLGYSGGFQISRQIYNRWWLGLETNISNINLEYKFGDGGIKSRISNRSINLQLRYKL